MADKYILNERGEVEPCDDLIAWGRWFETANDKRRVGNTEPVPGVRVSTVFLGLDHRYGDGPPLLFETMIFGGNHDEWQERCSTLDEAKAMHERAVKLVLDTTFP